jgi:hypothetical protein
MITSRTHQLGVKAKRYVTDRRGDATGRARLPGVHFPATLMTAACIREVWADYAPGALYPNNASLAS